MGCVYTGVVGFIYNGAIVCMNTGVEGHIYTRTMGCMYTVAGRYGSGYVAEELRPVSILPN